MVGLPLGTTVELEAKSSDIMRGSFEGNGYRSFACRFVIRLEYRIYFTCAEGRSVIELARDEREKAKEFVAFKVQQQEW